jgi:glutamate synthase (NADPH/NADH) large chain
VTNPPLDAIREELVTSAAAPSGPRATCSSPTRSCRQIVLPYPVIDNDDLAKLLYVNEHGETPGSRPSPSTGSSARAGGGPRGGRCAAHRRGVREVSIAAIADGANIIVLSDRNSTPSWPRSRRCC